MAKSRASDPHQQAQVGTIHLAALNCYLEVCDGNLVFPNRVFGPGSALLDVSEEKLLLPGLNGEVKVACDASYRVIEMKDSSVAA